MSAMSARPPHTLAWSRVLLAACCTALICSAVLCRDSPALSHGSRVEHHRKRLTVWTNSRPLENLHSAAPALTAHRSRFQNSTLRAMGVSRLTKATGRKHLWIFSNAHRIVGGRNSRLAVHRYMLALEVWGRILCGACVVDRLWALTAAHCLHDLDSRAGLTLRGGSDTRESGGREFYVEFVRCHEGFDVITFRHDICLLRPTAPFEVDTLPLPPAYLAPSKLNLPPGTMMTVLGWGTTRENGDLAHYLQETLVPLVAHEECRAAYGRALRKHMVCAGYSSGEMDACQADSGGPMLFGNMLYGIISFGEGCARPNRPGVYTRVSAYRNWIRRNTGI